MRGTQAIPSEVMQMDIRDAVVLVTGVVRVGCVVLVARVALVRSVTRVGFVTCVVARFAGAGSDGGGGVVVLVLARGVLRVGLVLVHAAPQ